MLHVNSQGLPQACFAKANLMCAYIILLNSTKCRIVTRHALDTARYIFQGEVTPSTVTSIEMRLIFLSQLLTRFMKSKIVIYNVAQTAYKPFKRLAVLADRDMKLWFHEMHISSTQNSISCLSIPENIPESYPKLVPRNNRSHRNKTEAARKQMSKRWQHVSPT